MSVCRFRYQPPNYNKYGQEQHRKSDTTFGNKRGFPSPSQPNQIG